MTSIRLQLLLPVVLILLCALPAHSHKIRVFAWAENSNITAETKFSGGKHAQNAVITVLNNENNVELLTGKTNSQGLFTFPIPQEAKENGYNLNIVVNSGDGHKNSWYLAASDYLQGYENHLSSSPPVEKNLPVTEKPQQESVVITLSEQQLNRIINTALDKQLAPIRRSLAEQSEQKPSLQDILGGIGYILGLAGLAAFLKSKKTSKE